MDHKRGQGRLLLLGQPMGKYPSIAVLEQVFSGLYTSLTPLPEQGAQALVFRADERAGASVVLKLYDPDDTIEERTEREVEALRQLACETVVELRNAGEISIGDKKYRFLATTFIDGEPLSAVIARGPRQIEDVARVGTDIADAIEKLWQLKIVHRDIKPANIMWTKTRRAVLIDLGLARHLDQRTLTATGYTCGTPGYFAPEHLAGKPLSCKADVFSLGICLQEMLAGRHPTRGRQNLLTNGGPSTARIRSDAPSRMIAVVDRMVDARAFMRPHPHQVEDELRRFGG